MKNSRPKTGEVLFQSNKIFYKLVFLIAACSIYTSCASDEAKDEATDSTQASVESNSEGDSLASNDLSADSAKTSEEKSVNPDLAQDTLGSSDVQLDENLEAPKQEANASQNSKVDEPVASEDKNVPPPPVVDNTPTPVPVTPEPPVVSSAAVDVTNVKYLADKNGGTVAIETSGEASFRQREGAQPQQIIIEIANAKLPSKFQRPLITKDFQQSIAGVNAYQDKGSSTARFVIQMRDHSTPQISQVGKTIYINSNAMASNASQSPSDADSSNGMSTFDASLDGDKIKPSKDESMDVNAKFTGKPISIEVKDESVSSIIEFISENSGANIIIGNDVQGKMTIKLKQVPWDQALLLVLKANQLGYVKEGNVLRIAPLESLKNESEKAAKVIESQREAQPLRVKVIPVSYAKVDKLATQVKEFLSKRGKSVADERTSSVVVTDIIENIDRVTNLIKALDTPPYQVLIEGKVVEAGEQFSKSIGINWSMFGVPIATGSQNLTPQLNIRPSGNDALSPEGINLGFQFGQIDVLGNINAALQLAEREAQVRVVSSPRVVAINNEAAQIHQTVNIFTKQITASGNTSTISYQKTPLTLSLEVVPQITAESDILMQIDLKREFAASTSTSGENEPPDINTREAKTKVMVRNGQTSVIGGIYQADSTNAEKGVPGLRNIPVIGWLFKNRTKIENKNELLLFLTPRIVSSDLNKSEKL